MSEPMANQSHPSVAVETWKTCAMTSRYPVGGIGVEMGVKTKITGVGVSATVVVSAGVASGESTNGALGVSVTGGWSSAIAVWVTAASKVAAAKVAN